MSGIASNRVRYPTKAMTVEGWTAIAYSDRSERGPRRRARDLKLRDERAKWRQR